MELPKEKTGTRKDLVFYRLQTAKADLKSAKILLAAEEYKGANNRAYYAIFHAINAIHALSGKAYKRHKDAIGSFNKDKVYLYRSCPLQHFPTRIHVLEQKIIYQQGKEAAGAEPSTCSPQSQPAFLLINSL